MHCNAFYNKRCASELTSQRNIIMAIVSTYLSFNGDCEKAFAFYKSVFEKEFKYIGRYKDVPEAARQYFPNCEDDHIMHIGLPISDETMLMGADIIDVGRKEKMLINFSHSMSVLKVRKRLIDYLIRFQKKER